MRICTKSPVEISQGLTAAGTVSGAGNVLPSSADRGGGVAVRKRATVVMVAERRNKWCGARINLRGGVPCVAPTASPPSATDVRNAGAARVGAGLPSSTIDPATPSPARSRPRPDHPGALAVADVGNPVYVSMMHAIRPVCSARPAPPRLASTGGDTGGPARPRRQPQPRLLRRADPHLRCGHHRRAPRRRPQATRPPPSSSSAAAPERRRRQRPRQLPGRRRARPRPPRRGEFRRRIAFLNGPVDTVPGSARLAGYLPAPRRARAPTSVERQVEAADFTYDAGVPAIERLLAQSTPDAIVCANDLIAVAALNVLRRPRRPRLPTTSPSSGWTTPRSASVVSPTLTSVNLGSDRRPAPPPTARPARRSRPASEARGPTHVVDRARPATSRGGTDD